jgi:hypothetical protein
MRVVKAGAGRAQAVKKAKLKQSQQAVETKPTICQTNKANKLSNKANSL